MKSRDGLGDMLFFPLFAYRVYALRFGLGRVSWLNPYTLNPKP